MQFKSPILVSAGSIVIAGLALSGTANSSGQSGALVRLQSTTPGVAQTGNSNVTGTVRAGQFIGAGSGVTDLNASNLASGTVASGRLSGLYSNALTFNNASNAFTGNGSGLTNVNAATLSGNAVSAFGLLGGTNVWTGVNTFGNAGNSFTGVGTGLTALNASNLTSGTLLSGRLSGTYSNALTFNNAANVFTGNGAALTNVNAAQLGGLPASQFGILNNTNTWGGINNFNHALNNFTGNGANLVGVDADKLDGLDSTAFLQSVPVPLTLTGGDGTLQVNGNTGAVSLGTTAVVTNSATATDAATMYLVQNNPNGGFGVYSDMVGPGTAVFANTTAGIGANIQTQSATNPALFALNGAGGPALQTAGASIFGGSLSIDTGSTPLFPLDFSELLGNKISLWGTDPASHYGFGIQAGQLQIFTSTVGDVISFGYGGSTALNETVRIINLNCELRLRPSGGNFSSRMTTPYDLLVDHDFDNNSTDSWIRIHTNTYSIEQVRIQDGDEAATLFDGAVTANGIDFAEGFKVHDQTLAPGDLVVNYGQDWEYVTRSQKAYDSAVIGVVSTKPAFVAGMSFNAEDNMDEELTKRRDAARAAGDMTLEKLLTKQMRELVTRNYRPIAFMGRVPVKVTGPVRPGDPLTASNIPGTAMAMNRAGHSIGIALESNGEGQGKIMVMIQPRYFNGLEVPTNSIDRIQGLEATVKELKSENNELRTRLDRMEQMLLKH